MLEAYEQRLLIGEIYLPVERLVTYYGHENSGAHLPFNFLLIRAPGTPPRSPASSRTTRPRCRPMPGPTGCWATTTSRASPRAWARPRRAWPPCCC
ncbi:hypothetical protein ACFQU7_15140 [Pseudoroseomonas wenyumeiae]